MKANDLFGPLQYGQHIPSAMREIVVLCCLAAGAATVDWRAALDLDETPYVQRARSAGWRADLEKRRKLRPLQLSSRSLGVQPK